MNQSNFRMACAAATFALLAPCAAQAQQTADVDALASLEPAATSLTVRGTGDMQFGLVTIPNDSRGISNVVCFYDITLTNAPRRVNASMRESPDFDAEPIGGVSPSGCEFRSVPPVAAASFEINCAPNIMTNYQVTWNSSTTDPAITFLPAPFGAVAFYASGSDDPLPNGFPSAGAVSCPVGGAIDVQAGGSLQVGQTAIAGADVRVGSVSLSVNY